MSEPARRYQRPVDVTTRLTQLGLTEIALRDAAAFGLAEASHCTEHDPDIARGFIQWEKTFRGLCDGLVLSGGWRKSGDPIYPRIVKADGSMTIAVMGGNANTGTDQDPMSRQPKGPLSKLAIQENLFDLSSIALGPQKRGQTWHFMYYTDWETGETKIELSLAIRMEPDGYIAGWHERIILEPLAGEPSPLSAADDDDQGPEIQVERRAS